MERKKRRDLNFESYMYAVMGGFFPIRDMWMMYFVAESPRRIIDVPSLWPVDMEYRIAQFDSLMDLLYDPVMLNWLRSNTLTIRIHTDESNIEEVQAEVDLMANLQIYIATYNQLGINLPIIQTRREYPISNDLLFEDDGLLNEFGFGYSWNEDEYFFDDDFESKETEY